MEIRLASPILQADSIVDGEGVRAVLWTQGCGHKCLGCHNPSTHSFDDGILLDIEEVKAQIDSLEGQDGITLSGGDPMYQVDACLELAKYIKSKKMNIWCYTGYDFEKDILGRMAEQWEETKEMLSYIDVLVDGPFLAEEKDLSLRFRGSRNQRLIDLRQTLASGQIVLWTDWQTERRS